jgi:hypothetical protein
VNVPWILKVAKQKRPIIEIIFILFAILGASLTLVLGGMIHSDTIRITDAATSLLPPYGESRTDLILGYNDSFNNWALSTPDAAVTSSPNSLVIVGTFQNVSTWTAVNLFKTANINITAYPILNVDVNLTVGVRYGLRFYSQYANGTRYNVWWEGSPLDHRDGEGHASLRVNMQREAFLATGLRVAQISQMQLYIEDPPNSPQSFQFTLSKLSFESDNLQPVSQDQYRAVYFDLQKVPQENASWYLDKINIGMTVDARQGTTFSIYFFDGPILYASSTASSLLYNSIVSEGQYTFYPDIQPLIFPELLPVSNSSIVFVATSGMLQSVTMDFANFEFLPTTTNPNTSQQSVALYYLYFVFFLFLLPVSAAILVFRDFFTRERVSKLSIVPVVIVGLLCRVALASLTTHVIDTNVYLTSSRSWFQFRTPLGSLGPTLPLTFFLYWTFYSPFAILQLLGFQDIGVLGHTAGIVESVFVKLFPIFMDALTFLLLLRFKNSGATFVWATFYFLNPWAILVSSVWGQYEAATTAFIVSGIYWLSRKRNSVAALAFIASGMVELLGFLPYLLLLLKTVRMKLYRTIPFLILAAIPLAVYPLETLSILRYFLGFLGLNVNNIGLSQPGRFTLVANFSQLAILSQFKPLLLSETLILAAAVIDTYRQRMSVDRLVLYTVLASVPVLLFANLIAFWFWLLPLSLLYAILREKNDLGAFMLVYGTSMAFLEMAYAFGSSYLILGSLQYVLVPAIEGVGKALKILSIMATVLTLNLLLLLKYGNGQARQTLLRTSAFSFSLFLFLYFWFGVYPL